MQKYKAAEPVSIHDAVTSQSASFAKMRRFSPDMAQTFLTEILLDLVDFFSVGKSMGMNQIALTGKLLMQEYYFLKPEDFKLCFTKAKKGEYGQLFDRLDGQVICGWLNQYCEERVKYFETKSDNEHERIKNAPPVNPDAVKLYSEIRANLESEIKKEDEYKTFKRNYLDQSKQPGA